MANKTAPLKKKPSTAEEEIQMVLAGEYEPETVPVKRLPGESGWDFMRRIHREIGERLEAEGKS